ncbi:transposase [Algoriphagus sp. Y33]|uniref:ISAon1 family transposase N-terminal region protein n=1 Tax=Algoriphagus sp. Y33 TaxID=2772483 RepID=UPI001781E777|nr:transposase [Algoriphagus sp. Y33]
MEEELEEKDYLSLILPQGLLEFFKVTSAVLKDNAYHIYLEELNIHPEHLQGSKLTSKGFYEDVCVQDFPLRGKACFLNVKRRKWLNEETGKNVSRDWSLVANGTRMTGEFALFLKRNGLIHRR